MRLVGAASAALKLPADDVVRWFGGTPCRFLPKSTRISSSRTSRHARFSLTLNDVIHSEVRKLYPGAEVPVFTYDTSSSEVLLMHYSSPRKLCALAEGFIEATAAHFDEELSLDQPECMKRGDEKCVLRVSVRKPGADAWRTPTTPRPNWRGCRSGSIGSSVPGRERVDRRKGTERALCEEA
jgi:hypothetical protein